MPSDNSLGLSVKKDNIQVWYPEVVVKADMADYSAVKGCMVIKPNAYSVWQEIQDFFNERLRELKVRNAYFPLFIPESFFKKEAEHAKGFKPEVAWVSSDNDSERLAIRPTSEAIIYDSYSKWIRTYRDLPLRLNQWANIVRWETKATRLFLRTREFLWQEGHCVYENREECERETIIFLNEYEKICKELLAFPVLKGYKSENEKFAGALYTMSVEAIMPDGKSLQAGTSHNLGQGFAKSFGIEFLGRDSNKNFVWQNSWGISTRLIGAMILVHGDDKGIILPPRVAYNKLVIVPIIFEDSKEKVMKEAKKLESMLKEFNPILDDNEEHSAGWKFNSYELKGIPIRIEIGPKDIKNKQITLVRRDNSKKIPIKIAKLKKEVKLILEDIQNSMYEKAKKSMESQIVESKTFQDFEKSINNKKIVKALWCTNPECEEHLKNKMNGVKTLVIPIDQGKISGNCIICNKEAKKFTYFGRSY
jgi:prolyl-tRNA synthetase